MGGFPPPPPPPGPLVLLLSTTRGNPKNTTDTDVMHISRAKWWEMLISVLILRAKIPQFPTFLADFFLAPKRFFFAKKKVVPRKKSTLILNIGQANVTCVN